MSGSSAIVPGDACLFLDFDGTLVDFAAGPKSVIVTPDLVPLLRDLSNRLDGALAVITGRALDDIDRMLWPLQLPTAALHGTMRRDGSGKVMIVGNPSVEDFKLASRRLRQQFQRWVARHPGVCVEDKGLALALHFRNAQPRWTPAPDDLKILASMLTPDLELLGGDLVLEVRLRGCNKRTAVEAFLAEPPFTDRMPIYIGDDVADVPAMETVERRGGMTIAIGARIDARWCMPDPAALRLWLAALARRNDPS